MILQQESDVTTPRGTGLNWDGREEKTEVDFVGAGYGNTRPGAVLYPGGFSQPAVWSPPGSQRGPRSSAAKADAPAQTGASCPGPALSPVTGAARTPSQGENCSFWGLWSLSGIRGKFFLVKDSPPLPCSGRCLYGAFQVPEELWEDFLFPFCYMAESQMSLGQIQRDLISHLKA